MKKHIYILIFLVFPLFVFSQQVEVDGKMKITEMDTINTENHLVVKSPDGTLATRLVSSLPPPAQDTTRTLQSDLLLTSALCNCPDLPSAMIQSLLDNGYSHLDLINFQISIAELFAAGQTPIDLFNGGVSIDSLYGLTYAGGLIFYLDTFDVHPSFEGLVASPDDQSNGAEWGCNGILLGGTSSGIGTGEANTIAIVGACSQAGIAARLCDDLENSGYDDWFLPSKDELNQIYQNLKLNGFGGISPELYWSSTEYSNFLVSFQDFNLGNQSDFGSKFGLYRVRAVRAF